MQFGVGYRKLAERQDLRLRVANGVGAGPSDSTSAIEVQFC